MAKNSQVRDVFEKVSFLFERYSMERHATTQPFLLEVVRENVAGYKYAPDDELVRETLMEHVGSLPMLATALFPYVVNDSDVKLGDALTILAIHDIGKHDFRVIYWLTTGQICWTQAFVRLLMSDSKPLACL